MSRFHHQPKVCSKCCISLVSSLHLSAVAAFAMAVRVFYFTSTSSIICYLATQVVEIWGFPTKRCIRLFSFPYALHVTPISLFSILSPEHIIKLLIMYFSPLPCYLVPRRPKYSSQHPVLKHFKPTFLPQCERPSFTPIKITGKIIVLCILIFKFFDSKLEDKSFCTK